MLEEFVLPLPWARLFRRRGRSPHRQRPLSTVWSTVASRGVVSAILLHRHHRRCVLRCRGDLPGHSPLMVSICRSCPPAHTLRSSPEPRNIDRFAGVDVYSSLSMVQRQWFLCALQRVSLVQLDAFLTWYGTTTICDAFRSYSWCAFNGRITHLSTVEHASVGPMEAGER